MTGDMAAAVKTAIIERSDTASGGRYTLRADGHEAEMTFSRVNPNLIIVDHTGVPDTMRGTGAGQRLAVNAIEDARGAAGRSYRSARSCARRPCGIRNGRT